MTVAPYVSVSTTLCYRIGTTREENQPHLTIDVSHLEGNYYLQIIDPVSGWSVVGLSRRRDLEEQIRMLSSIQRNRHGIPQTIFCDREFNKGVFQILCNYRNIRLIQVPAGAHECHRAVERSKLTLRSFLDRPRICHQKSPAASVAQEATFEKNINRGNRLASLFELIYSHSPRPSGILPPHETPTVKILDHNARLAHRNILAMLRTNIRDPYIRHVCDEVFIWRDNIGWLGPAPVTKVDVHSIEVLHNGRTNI